MKTCNEFQFSVLDEELDEDTKFEENFSKNLPFSFFLFSEKTVFINFIFSKFVLGYKNNLQYLLGWLFTNQFGFFQVMFLKLYSIEI